MKIKCKNTSQSLNLLKIIRHIVTNSTLTLMLNFPLSIFQVDLKDV